SCCHIVELCLALAPVAACYVLHVVGVRDRREYADNKYGDHQFNQGEALVGILHVHLSPTIRQVWRPMLVGSGKISSQFRPVQAPYVPSGFCVMVIPPSPSCLMALTTDVVPVLLTCRRSKAWKRVFPPVK